MKTLIETNQVHKNPWNALTYFNFYRFLLAFLFVTLYWTGQLPAPFGVYDKDLFFNCSHLYLILSVLAQFVSRLRRPPYGFQVCIQVFTDITIITLLMYASNGLSSGFGMLLAITVAFGSLLIPGKIGFLFAALATIAVLGEEIYVHLFRFLPLPNYTHAGLLGITYFMTAGISYVLAGRVRESEARAQQSRIDLENLARLNEHIVQRLQSGIVVLDENLDIRLVNESAGHLLGLAGNMEGKNIGVLSSEIYQNALQWKSGGGKNNAIIHPNGGGIDIQASFVVLNLEDRIEILVFLDDVSLQLQRAQQMKLASLARLTASIAHEIRNPLGAISHAGQLLSESNSLKPDDRRLTAIIEDHSRRINRIIENIQSISRRERSLPVVMELEVWLEDFLQEFITRPPLQRDAIELQKTCQGGTKVRMDAAQFRQILINLLENGIRYANGKRPAIVINIAIEQTTGRPYIDVRDFGTGITEDAVQHLFEPFFTTAAGGTGLGLYIARELCEANQATLNLHDNSSNGCCFRIKFAHPEKQHSLI